MFKFSLLFVTLLTFSHGVLQKPNGKIVGGQDANIKDYPYQVSIQYFGSHFCGGSILNPDTILTAAHCTYERLPYGHGVRAGSTNKEKGGQYEYVEEIHQHPLYNPVTIDYDISILKLYNKLVLGRGVKPIALPDRNYQAPPELHAIVTGWGVLKEGGKISPDILQYLYVPIVSRQECREIYSRSLITDRMICAGYTQGGMDACQGDSGGPLVLYGTQIGVVSWGWGCAAHSFVGVYTNVANLRDFIDKYF